MPKRYKRPLGKRRYRKIFYVAAEGEKTEIEYLRMFNSDQSTVHVQCLLDRHSKAPLQVLNRLKKYIKDNQIRKDDEVWVVVDRDQWDDDHLRQLHDWKIGGPNRGFALSNPKFEYWLLLHFEDGRGVSTSSRCSACLKKYLPDYNKSIQPLKFTLEMIETAIRRAKERDTPPCADWPRTPPGTTVYRLVERILNPDSRK